MLDPNSFNFSTYRWSSMTMLDTSLGSSQSSLRQMWTSMSTTSPSRQDSSVPNVFLFVLKNAFSVWSFILIILILIHINLLFLHSQCMFETHGWARWRGSPPLTLSTPLSFATEEGCRSTFSTLRWRLKYSRSSSDWDTYGTGDRLLIQSGTPENLISIPLTQAEADMTSDWWGIGQKKTWQKHIAILKLLQVWSFLLRWNGRSLPPVRLHPWTGFTITKRVIFFS